MTVYAVPEVGGDAGIGVLRCLAAMGVQSVVGFDAEAQVPVGGLGLDVQYVWIPRVDQNMSQAVVAFRHWVEAQPDDDVIVLPTGEFFPELVRLVGGRCSCNRLRDVECRCSAADRRMAHAVSLVEGCVYLGSRKATGFDVARDKLMLAEVYGNDVVSTRHKWDVDHCFAKPRHGVGSRGCRIVLTREEASAMGRWEDYVFTQFLNGDDYVVDVVRQYAWTRQVQRQRGGADTILTYVQEPRMEDIATAVIWGMGAVVGNVQFRRTASGETKIIDVGLRYSGASCAALKCGLNPVALLLDAQYLFKRPEGRVMRRWQEVAWTQG
jgi:hypothetical protein